MSNRPAGDPIVFASEDTFPDHTALAGQPNKVRPPDSIIARGAYPDRKMPVGWFNYVLHDVSARVAYLDLLDLLNFDEVDSSLVADSVSLATETCVCWDPFARVFWMVEGTTGMRVYYSPDGKAWTEDTTLAGTPAEGESIAYDTDTCFVLALERTTGVGHLKNQSNAWSELGGLMSNMTVRGIVANPYAPSVPFIIFGQDSANNRPKVYTCTVSGTPAATKRDLQNEASMNTSIRWVACAPDRVVCMGVNGRVWYFVGAGDGTWLESNGAAELLANPVGMSYDEVNRMFWAIDNDGTIVISRDAISWVQPDSATSFDFEVSGGVTSFNGIWICRAQIDNPPAASLAGQRMLVSTDFGVTWQDIPCPVTWTALCSEAGRKLLAIGTDGKTSRAKRTR